MAEDEKQPKTMEYHRQVLQSRLERKISKCLAQVNRCITQLIHLKEQAHLRFPIGHDHESRDQETGGVEGEEIRKVSTSQWLLLFSRLLVWE